MGQRLVISILNNGEMIANAYYHWSAYTGSAATLTNDIVEMVDEADSSFTPVQKAVWLLYKTGARFYPNEITWAKDENIDLKQFDFAFDGVEADRNDGLLSVSQRGMNESTSWSEGDVSIDIGNGEINFEVMHIDTVEDFIEDAYDVAINTLPVVDLDYDLDFGNWNVFYETLERTMKKSFCAISPDRNIVYQFIC